MTRLVGREDELRALTELLADPGARLVKAPRNPTGTLTLTGAWGGRHAAGALVTTSGNWYKTALYEFVQRPSVSAVDQGGSVKASVPSHRAAGEGAERS